MELGEFATLCKGHWLNPVELTIFDFRKVGLRFRKKPDSPQEAKLPKIALHLGTNENSNYKFSSPDRNKTLLEPVPSELVFQNYVLGKVCEMPLLLRNRDKVTQLVKVTMDNSPYFKLVGPNGVCHQIPPGSFCTINILFTPEGSKDHFHQLVCISEREKVFVPIRAIGARPVLDFPDQLDFSSCPVNHSTQKTLLVHNTGNLETCYSLSTESPFTVGPATGTLDVGEAMQVTVEYHPLETGHHSTSLAVHCDRGEDTHTRLLGKAKDFNIGLDKYSLELDKTYLTLSSHRTTAIHNRSNITARFQWKAFATEAEEYPQKIRLCHNLSRPPQEIAKALVMKRYEELDLYDRELEKETAKIQADPMLFSDDVFTIEPLEGEVGPHCSAEIKVFFKPREAQVYRKVAYCSISGRESRLPLCLTGEGLGPCLQLNSEELDMGKVLVGKTYSYEAMLVNKGAIDAPFELIPPTTAHGSWFTFRPQQGIIPPSGLQPIQISFSSSTLGEFEVEFHFNVTESPKPVTLTIRGHVTGLSLHFSTGGLDFNDVSFGFPQTLSCRLINTSVVPITFHLRIPEDGQGQPSLRSFDQVKDNAHPSWEKGTLAPCHEKPVEFTIRPSTATIPSQGSQEIRVTLCSNDVGRYDYDMVVDVDGFGKEVLALRLKARCVVPELRLLTSTLDCGPCSAKVPCQKMLILVNPSPLPGCYRVLPQRHQEAAALWYSSPKPCGIIQGHNVVEIPITVEVQAVGAHSIPVDIAVFGKERSPLQMHLMCTGKTPLVYASVNKINFGKIQVIQNTSQTLQLCNLGLIPAAFRAEIGGKCWSIEPREGVVPAKAEVPVVVMANLGDTGRFEDSMKLFVENSLTSVIPIQAVGTGTTIAIDKPFAPELNLEPQFNLVPCIFRFNVTNKGQQFQRLYWGTFRQRHPLPALSVTKGRNASQRPTPPVFKLQPRGMYLQPGETMELMLEGFSSTVQEVEEKLVCEAAVGPEITKKEIIKTKVTCKFISPTVQISSRAITFCVEKTSHLENCMETEQDSFEESSDSEDSLETEQDSSEESSDPEDSLETEDDSPEQSSDPENSLETKQDSSQKSSDSEDSLETEQDSSEESSHSEDSPEAKVPPYTAAGPRSSVETKRSGQSAEVKPPGFRVEEVFDIQPVSGVLQPGKSQQVPFTFFGHANIIARVTVLCQVEGGPTYEVELRGETSVLTYHLSVEEIDCGLQLFNEVTKAEVTLRNNGKMGFTYMVQSPSTGTADKPLPGVLVVLPSTASIEPGKEQVLKLYYLPGVPGVFCRTFQVQVGHLKPAEISLKGEAVFAGIYLDLPWSINGSEKYEKLLKQAKEKLKKDKQDKKANTWLRMEMEQMLIKENALELQPTLISRPPEDTVFDKSIPQKLVHLRCWKSYETELKINIRGNSQLLVLHISGQGLEPQLEFNPTEIKLGAVLPCSPELETTVVVKNPCEFPIEFYSLEFDEEYREEEKILMGKKGAQAKKTEPSPADKANQKTFSAGPQSASATKDMASDKPQMAAVSCATAPAPQQLTILTRTGRKEKKRKFWSCVLPEELLVEIISERLQLSDCYKGVVFDGLETLFASSLASSLLCVLKAVSNRPHIHVVNIFQDSEFWKGRQIAARERRAAKKQQKEAARREEERLWDVDVDEYEALPEKQKALLDYKIEQIKREWNERRELEWLAREREESKKMLSRDSKKQDKLQKKKNGCSVKFKLPAKEQQQETKSPEVRMKSKTTAAKQQQQETKISEVPSKHERILDLRFNIYESSQKRIRHILSSWDRVQGIMNQVPDKSQSSPKHKDEKKSSKSPEKAEKKPLEKHGSHKSLQWDGEVAEGSVGSQDAGVPCLDFHITRREKVFRRILKSKKLPPAKQILHSLGLGPPIPPGCLFSVVPYPEEDRVSTAAQDLRHFILVEPEGAAAEDDVAPEAEAQDHLKEGKATSRHKSSKEKQNTPQSPKSLRDHSPETPRSLPESKKSQLQSDSTLERPARLRRFRWIVPAHSEVELKIHFSTTVPGQFDQMMNFEILGSKRLYQLPCSATALYPSISQNPRLVFPHWRKSKEKEDIIFKEYVMSTKQFHFGPLLCGKSREWYKAQNCPGNSEKLTILNDFPMEAEVHFSFENDSKGETFLLDPPSMRLQPKEKKKLSIWAYPTSTGLLEDSLVCCIRDNPEPVVFQLCCQGVQVKLGVSPQELRFNKLLLHRTDTQTLVLRNDSPLPMAWHLSGLHDLGDDFSVSQGRGIVGPRTDFEVKLNFKAEKIGITNKMIRLEVSDTENILGIVHAETIKVSVEVYDVNLSIDMPEGPDGSLEFGTINVLDNKKHVLSLQNKGLYDIEYSFKLTTGSAKRGDLESPFTVRPQRAVLKASQPPVKVEVLFHPTTEVFLESKPILLCQVIDLKSGQGGETVATIPVRVSARAVYSKYSIEPASPIDFGAMVKGTKKAQLTVGMFTVSPCSGSIGPWGQQKITVDCNAGAEGKCEEQLYIDISNRDPKDNPLGIPFTLTAESCFPALVEDVTSIFEQYPIHSNVNLCQTLQSVQGNGVFIRDDNKFIFTKVQVGQRATARFKISNGSSVPCDVVLSIKALPGEPHSLISNIFKLDPVEMSIPGLSHTFATVTFTPEQKEDYQCTFTASLVIPKSSSVKMKPQQLTFTVSGEGHVPQVTVECPGLGSKRGTPVLRFRRLLLGDSQTLPLVLRNNGIVPTKFTVQVMDEQGVFFLKGRQSALHAFHTADMEENSTGKAKKHPKKPYLLLEHSQSAEFDVFFKPTLTQRLEGKIHVALSGNSEIDIELVGEGYDDDFTLDNLHGLAEDSKESNTKGNLEDNIIEAVRANHIEFGECAVRELCDKTFTVTNRSKEEVMRFEWLLVDAPFQFSPKVGHLQPGCAKDIRVTLKSNVPVTFKGHSVKCKVAKIKYQLPPEEVYDWDNEMCTEKWEDTTERVPGARWPLKQKVVKALLEPPHTVLKSSHEVELFLSAQVDYAEFKLNTVEVQLKQIELFQTEISTFQMSNTGNVALKYCWEGNLEEEIPSKSSGKPFSSTLTRKLLALGGAQAISVGAEPGSRDSHVLGQDWEGGHQGTSLSFGDWEKQGWNNRKQSCWEQRILSLKDVLFPLPGYFLSSAAVDHWYGHCTRQMHGASPLKSTQPQSAQPQSTQPQPSLRLSKQVCHSLKGLSSSLEFSPIPVKDPPLFSIEPHCGTIPAGQNQIFHVKFCPTHVGKFKAEMLCRLPNLKPSQKSPRVFVMGKGCLPKADLKRSTSPQKGKTQSNKPKKKVQQSPKLE
ncbi:hydrocephalus-inducing protein-like [Manacus vitellinus]|uniref:hydrocephalus-inducing protein-like n=1 Tax=Manacus vitellinus TaxID=328815 RepID=UPI00115C4B2D|nr:hydrocephalus-inducing protein-like [Manacus vitellinus]